jgi:hypothetical protein
VLVVLPLMVWPSFTMFMILLRVPWYSFQFISFRTLPIYSSLPLKIYCFGSSSVVHKSTLVCMFLCFQHYSRKKELRCHFQTIWISGGSFEAKRKPFWEIWFADSGWGTSTKSKASLLFDSAE